MKLFFLMTLIAVFAGGYIYNPVFWFEKIKKPAFVIPIDESVLETHVRELASAKPPRSSKHPKALDKAAGYIRHAFESAGGEVSSQVYQTPDNLKYQNIVCGFGPKNKPLIVIGAHYDVCGEMPGADDNASGVAGLLELARIISILKPELDNRIELVAYSLEEPPYFRTPQMGSAQHAAFLKESGKKVKLMISLEMIGYFSDKPGSQQYPLAALKYVYPSTGDFIALVGNLKNPLSVRRVKKLMQGGSKIPVRSLNAPESVQGIDFSDHLNYWTEGYDALMITNTSFFRNPNYHRPGDLPETLDYKRMAEVMRGVYWAVLNY